MSFLLSMFSGLFIVLGGIKTVQPLGPLFLVLLIQICLLSSKSLNRETTLTKRRVVAEKVPCGFKCLEKIKIKL